jgi:hypothetical protein
MANIRLDLIQDAFDRCRRSTAPGGDWRKVNAVADVIRDVGYEVVVGVYGTGREQEGRPLGPGPWPETTLEELEMTDSGEYNYAIFSIMRRRCSAVSPSEYVYGSPPIGPPWSGDTAPASSRRCDWAPFPPGCSDEEKLAKWPLSGHKSLPHYLANHPGELILGPGKQLVTDSDTGDPCFRGAGGCFYNASRAEWAEYQGPERVGVGATPVGVSGCGSPDRLTFARFVDQFYLGSSSMRSSYQQWHTEHLIRTGAVSTIANTLPPDIVEALLRSGDICGNLWEFIVPAELTRATQEMRHTSCVELSVDGIQLPLACPCDEGGSRDDGSSGGGAAAAVAAVCPPNGDAPPTKEDSGSSSEEED